MRVPIEAPQISMNVPGADMPSAQDAARPGASQAAFGQELLQQSMATGEYFLRLNAKTEADRRSNQFKVDVSDKLDQLKLQSPDGYIRDEQGNIVTNKGDGKPRTIAHELRDWANDRYRQDQEELPTGMAQEEYKADSLPVFNTFLIHAQQTAREKAAEWDNQVMTDLQRASENRLVALGETRGEPLMDAGKFYGEAKDNTARIMKRVGLTADLTTAKKAVMLSNASAGARYIEGQINAIVRGKSLRDKTRTEHIDEVEKILKGEDDDSRFERGQGNQALTDMLDPATRVDLWNKLQALRVGADKVDKEQFETYYRNTMAAVEQGQGSPETLAQVLPTFFKRLNEMKKLREKDGQDQKVWYADHVSGVLMKVVAGNTFGDQGKNLKKAQEFNQMSFAEAIALKESIAREVIPAQMEVMSKLAGSPFEPGDKALAGTAIDQFNKAFDSALEAKYAKMRNDPAQFSRSNSHEGILLQGAGLDKDPLNTAAYVKNAGAWRAWAQSYKSKMRLDPPRSANDITVPDPQAADTPPITGSEIAAWSSMIKGNAGMNSAQIASALLNIDQTARTRNRDNTWHHEFPAMLRTMIQKGVLDEKYSALVYPVSKGDRNMIRDTIDALNSTGIESNIEAQIRSEKPTFLPELEKKVSDKIQENMAELRSKFTDVPLDKLESNVRLVIKNRALSLYRESKFSASADDVAQRAVDSLMNKGNVVIRLNRRLLRTNYVPESRVSIADLHGDKFYTQKNADDMAENLYAFLTPENIGKLNEGNKLVPTRMTKGGQVLQVPMAKYFPSTFLSGVYPQYDGVKNSIYFHWKGKNDLGEEQTFLFGYPVRGGFKRIEIPVETLKTPGAVGPDFWKGLMQDYFNAAAKAGKAAEKGNKQ